MPYFKKIVGERCYLSPCQPEDAALWAKWENDLETAIPLGDEAYLPSTVEKVEQRIHDIIRDDGQVFNIILQEGDLPIGRCMLFNIDAVNRHAMLGIVIGEKQYWGQGYGEEATRLVVDYGFNLLNLNNIMLGVFSFNQRAIQCYERVGFKLIGRRREVRVLGQKKYDVLLMDLLASEFHSRLVEPFLSEN
jgi:RimJ/RimL family protein N-acetyltransferase